MIKKGRLVSLPGKFSPQITNNRWWSCYPEERYLKTWNVINEML
jgi:hypothetical protein